MKIIEKILDKYYAKKLDDFVKFIELEYYLDFKHIYTKKDILIQVKEKRYNDDEYLEIIHLKKKDSFIHLCNRNKLEKYIKKIINEYGKKQR